MQDAAPEHHQTAIHEYTHLVVEHLGVQFPLWFNEGVAELYSSLEPKGDQAIVGCPLEGRERKYSSPKRWLDLNSLFAVDEQSPFYNERDKMSIFYAESWALTDMLELGDKYRPNFPKFLAALASGRSSADSLQSAYGESLAEVTKDLQAYVHQSSVRGAVFNVQLPKSALEPDVSQPSDFAVDLTLAELLASGARTRAEAAARLSTLASAHPENAEVQELGVCRLGPGQPRQSAAIFQARDRQRFQESGDFLHVCSGA